MSMFVEVELFTLAEGSAVKLFDAGLKKITEDLADAAAKEDAPRSFSLRFTVQPIPDTGTAKVTIELRGVKMAPSRAAVTGVQVDRTGGRIVLKEQQQDSLSLGGNVLKHEKRN